MIKKQTYLATYKHSEYWFVEVYKSVDAEEYFVYQQGVCEEYEGEFYTDDTLHHGDPYTTLPTWQEAKWFYDNYGD